MSSFAMTKRVLLVSACLIDVNTRILQLNSGYWFAYIIGCFDIMQRKWTSSVFAVMPRNKVFYSLDGISGFATAVAVEDGLYRDTPGYSVLL